MQFGKDDIDKLGRLARIALTDEERERLPEELGRIVTYVEQLQSVDVEGVEPMVHAGGSVLRLRADEAKPVAGRDAVRTSAGFTAEGMTVPKVVG
jgi:aspartyl-tRNA(Asn)/glutamyl-tRNA(Gln) amidotransferase subunit C